MKTPFSIKANITLDDYLKFSNYYQSRRRGILISCTLVLALNAAHLYTDLKTQTLLYCIITSLVMFGTFGLILWYVFYTQKQQFHQNYEQYIEESADKVLTFTEKDVFIKTPNTETTVNWSMFSKIEEKEALICLYNNQNQAHVIPKRSFDKKEEVDSFLSWVRLKLKQ
jgi:Ca2+/H+ antiporter